MKQSSVVGLIFLGDLEGVGLAALHVVVGGPGEASILGLVGDDLDIPQVAGRSFAESNGHGLVDDELSDVGT